ncbi:MAG TPA: hypothetical protein VOA87_18960 [Thermoanaerobaculia bacterium]|nr:hypothetical protein [Thermoanaerobaculia bacterium]
MRSLFLVSLPRSLSTQIYHAARGALRLAEPSWTSDGEVLNLHRFALSREEGPAHGVRFLERERDPDRFERLLAFLGQATAVRGFAYKDVVHPFAVAEWLPTSGLNALRIDRPLADVAFAMLERGWLYPREAAGDDGDPERQLAAGLGRARRALASLPGPTLAFDDIVVSERPLEESLRTLYPDADFPPPRYLDESFREVRDEVLERRKTERYRRLEEICREVAGD